MGVAEFSRNKEHELDPKRITPTSGKVLIRRKTVAELWKGILLPKSEERRNFEGEILQIGKEPGDGYELLLAGDKVWFSPAIGEDDTIFFKHDDASFVLCPTDAIQAVEA